MSSTFDSNFEKLTGHAPFPWQRDLFTTHFVKGLFPDACTLPTGLGKTSVVAVWLLALAANPSKVPRRLVYVVNRRTVVDQTTAEVEKYRTNLNELPDLATKLSTLCAAPVDSPLALSTLRGQFADNREWSGDPARPAVVVGTVDMIGSRLLFSGYGCGFRTRPLHAGFLGQDALLIHDEAHLEPAFQALIEAIRAEQRRCNEFRPFHVTALTATPRGGGNVFRLSDADHDDTEVKKRLTATKALTLHALKDAKKPAAELTAQALTFEGQNRAVLVFARSVDAVTQVVEALKKDKARAPRVEQLTGTLRGLERDALATKNKVFARFLPAGDRKCETEPGTVYLVCTSAGEVGVNLSADDLVCDLTPFDSMAQRFGRVNRFGANTDTQVHVFHPTAFEDDDLGPPCERTLALLVELNDSASPAALGKLDETKKQAAFTPTPTILPTSDILFDAWALTTVRGKLPGRPPVEPYLHGLAGWEPPETHVAWRDEVWEVKGDLLGRYKPTELLELYPLKPHELLRDRTDRVFKQLERLKAAAETPVWLVDDEDDVTPTTLGDVLEAGKDALAGLTVLLPPRAGGLAKGLLSGDSTDADDVSDHWYADAAGTVRRRVRVWDAAADFAAIEEEYREITHIDLPGPEEDEDAEGRSWYWFERPADGDSEGSTKARGPVSWDVHTLDVVTNTTAIAGKLLPSDRLGELLVIAARLHDLGKKRAVFQRVLGNFTSGVWLAKSGKKGGKLAETYRHEFGSLLDAADAEGLEPDERELVLHLVAAHHGRARPHFPANEAFDPERPMSLAADVARAVPQRFARLQRKYGRWGLAYLESLLRAADYAASAKPSSFVKEGG